MTFQRKVNIATVLAIVVLFWLLLPNRIDKSKVYGGPCWTATWGEGWKYSFRLVLQRNKYYTGVGCNLPGSKRSACDYAISLDDNSLNRQYPSGKWGVGIREIIKSNSP